MSVTTIPTFADRLASDAAARSKQSPRNLTDAMRETFDHNGEIAVELAQQLVATTAERKSAHDDLQEIGLMMRNEVRRKVVGILASDEVYANYDNRLATARIVRDHIIAGHLTYRESKSYKAQFAAVKLDAASKVGIGGKTDAARCQSAVRLAQFAVLCETFGARDFASVAYLLRNRLTGWARFDKTSANWAIMAPNIGGVGKDKFRNLSADDINAVRLALDAAAHCVQPDSPDSAFCDTLVSLGLMEASAVKLDAAVDVEASDDAVDAAVSRSNTLPIVDAFAALNAENAALCVAAWLQANTLDAASELLAKINASFQAAFAPTEAADEVYAADESEALNS